MTLPFAPLVIAAKTICVLDEDRFDPNEQFRLRLILGAGLSTGVTFATNTIDDNESNPFELTDFNQVGTVDVLTFGNSIQVALFGIPVVNMTPLRGESPPTNQQISPNIETLREAPSPQTGLESAPALPPLPVVGPSGISESPFPIAGGALGDGETP